MKKLFVLAFLLCFALTSVAFAFETPTVDPGLEVEGGDIESNEPLTTDELNDILDQLADVIGGIQNGYGGKVDVFVAPGADVVIVHIHYHSGGGHESRALIIYNRSTGRWEVVRNAYSSDAASVSNAPDELRIVPGGVYDQLPDDPQRVSFSYLAANVVQQPTPTTHPRSSGSGCSVGSVGGLSAVLLLFVPAVIMAFRKR